MHPILLFVLSIWGTGRQEKTARYSIHAGGGLPIAIYTVALNEAIFK
jgi:hypothetical protein